MEQTASVALESLAAFPPEAAQALQSTDPEIEVPWQEVALSQGADTARQAK